MRNKSSQKNNLSFALKCMLVAYSLLGGEV